MSNNIFLALKIFKSVHTICGFGNFTALVKDKSFSSLKLKPYNTAMSKLIEITK